MGMKSRKQDGGECWRRWYKTREANLLRLSGKPPKILGLNQLNLTVCCRYGELLLKNGRINRYLAKHHPAELGTLRDLSAEFEKTCQLLNKP